MNEIIIDAGNHEYLSQFLDDLPDNAFLNKVLTGCGNTFLALTAKKNYVITVPYISLIKNKLHSHPNAFGVYGGINESEILQYINSDIEYKKILVTYDSLGKLSNLLDTKQYKLLIDEAHKLIDSAAFRTDAIETVLENYEKYASYCFATATPVKDKYQLPELINIQKYKIQWNNIKPVTINYTKYDNNLNQRIAVLIIRFLKGELKGNPYFFINSVTSIIQIIKELKKAGYNDPSLYKIICGNNSENLAKIQRQLGKKYTIEFTTDPLKKITFCTATLFEGSDLYDEDGVTYAITDGNKDFTKYDLLTTLPQIIGRLRNSKYKDNVYVILTPSYYFSYTSVEEFEIEVRKQLKKAEKIVSSFNENLDNDMFINTLKKGSEVNMYVLERNDKLKVNTSVLYNEIHNYEALHTQYYYKDNAVVLINTIPHTFIKANADLEITGLNKLRLSKKASFKDICITYIKCKEENVPTQIKDIELEFPVIKQAYEELGSEKMKALNYRKNFIEDELIVHGKLNNHTKIVKLLDLKVGEIFTKEYIKLRLQSVYDQLGIDKIAKTTDLKSWYTIADHKKRAEGKVNTLIKIVTCNIKGS